jgi:hypothetical protein
MDYGSGHYGGAIEVISENGGSAALKLVNNIIESNEGTYGGAIYAYNRASSMRLNLANNLIRGNSGSYGGGIYVRTLNAGNSFVDLVNNIIVENTARYGGGAYFYSTGWMDVDLMNNTITGNTSSSSGGGLYARSFGDGTKLYVDVTNSIVWGNGSWDDIYIYEYDWPHYSRGTFYPYDTTTTVSALYSDIGDVYVYSGAYNDLEANIDEDPYFVDYPNGDYHLEMGSPAIDSGLRAAMTPRYDFEGDERGNFIDMGADEF